MLIKFTVYYTDSTSRVVEVEKPRGAHPHSRLAFQAGIEESEKDGKVVDKITITGIFSRADIMSPKTKTYTAD